jgi:hypothetical protein
MLICMPKFNIVMLCSAFEKVKQFFLSDSFVSDIVILNHFSLIFYYNCSDI